MHPTSPSEWELVGTDPLGDAFHPTFTANGHFGARIPAAGQGYSRHRVETQFQVAGLFAAVEDQGVRREIRAGAPAWTGLRLSDGTGSFDDCFDVTLDAQCRGSVEDHQQVLDLATGEIRTQARWTSPGGNTHDVSYTVVTDRAQDDRALVHLRGTPPTRTVS
ncbi:MAG: hypothetical protein L0K65_06075 [Actinomyces sp.]|nr:hypothetical protein [Actinomyces sp.]